MKNSSFENNEKYIECLIADFNSIKNEIAGRSNLQRISIVGYITIIVFIGREILINSSSILIIFGMWFLSGIVFFYYIREHYEICRLGSIIKERIVPILSSILEVERENIFQSETNNYFENISKKKAVFLFKLFNLLIYFILPLLLTIFYLILTL